MTPRRAPNRPSARLPALLAAGLACAALPVRAEESQLEVTSGPHETRWMRLQQLQVLLDGSPLPVTGGADADPDRPLCSAPLRPGTHQVDVVAGGGRICWP